MRSPLLTGVLGALFFVWMATPRVIDPTEVGWVMKGDWQWHFLGWHLFRNEGWTLPPGAITSYLEPIGSALGYTDSIPLVALLLKPIAALLPNPFQYLGLWFLVCFALQGFFGALVVSTWTPRASLQVAGGSLLVLLPTLLARMAHPALSSHWLLLWPIWLNWRGRGRGELAQHAALGLMSGLVHPYLAIMVLVLLLPLAVRRAIRSPEVPLTPSPEVPLITITQSPNRTHSRLAGVFPFSTAVATVFLGWWASGLFTVSSRADLQSPGLGDYSMNLLGPLTPAGRSVFLPDLPVVTIDQIGEGFHYFGAGVLGVCAIAAVLLIRNRRRWSLASMPLLLVLCGCGLYALSPRVSVGNRIVVDLVDQIGSVSMLRASARFFWPVTYVVAAGSIGVVASTLRPRLAFVIVAGALLLQIVDLHKWFLSVHDGARGNEFYTWDTPLRSPEWHELLSASASVGVHRRIDDSASVGVRRRIDESASAGVRRRVDESASVGVRRRIDESASVGVRRRIYERIRLYSPEFCRGPIPVPFVHAAYLAGIHGLRINDGFAARVDGAKQARECERLRDEFEQGVVDDFTVYLIAPPLLADFEQRAGASAACRHIDGVAVCVTTRSLERGGTTSVPRETVPAGGT